MKKRLLSALLTFCMVLTLLPVSALAAPDSGTSAGSSVSTDPDGPVQIHKSVTEDPSGNLSLTLEAYLTNEAEVTYTSTPLDIVLALDTSGSMSPELLGMALGSIASYGAAREVPLVRVIFCDARAYDAGYLAPEEIAGRVQVKGRGGTILQPGIDLLEQAKDFPNNVRSLLSRTG